MTQSFSFFGIMYLATRNKGGFMKKVGLDFFKEVNFLSQLKAKGDYLSYVVSNADMDKNDYTSSIYLYNIKDQNHRRLTSGTRDGSYLWLNEEEILFRGKRDENKKKIQETHFYKINVNGGEAEKFLSLPYQIGKIEYIKEGQFLFVASYIEALDKIKDLKGHEKEDYIKSLDEEDDYEVIEEIPFWSNGGTYSKSKRNALYLYDQKTNVTTKLTDLKFQVLDFSYEKDFDNVILSGKNFEGKMEIFNHIYLVDLESKSLKQVSKAGDYSYKKWIQIDENTLMMYGADTKTYGLNENGKFSKFDLSTGQMTLMTPDLYHSTGNAVGSDLRIGNAPSPYVFKDQKLVFPYLDGYTSKLKTISVDGQLSDLLDTRAALDEFLYHEGKFYGICLYKNSPQEIYDLETMKALSTYNHSLLEEYDVRTPEAFAFDNREGISIDGFIIKPSNFNEKMKYPLILDIHGGPKTAYGDILYHEMQYWANEGYVVIYCNPRGSDGKENAFADIRGKYGTIDYFDIMDFVDEVVKRYDFIDEERMGVTGGSYGGFMTNWIIGQTNRFKAAASQRSIANWAGFFGTSDIGYFFASDQVGATPWSDPDKMWDQSPIKYADQAKTPTLFIHSQEDYRCWTPEAYQMFTALKYHGIESRLVMFSGENHELSRSGKPKHRVRRLNEITKWMDQYLK